MTKTSDNRAIAISYEDAMAEVANLQESTRYNIGGVEIYSGQHEEYGFIYIVLPAVSECLILLPFASQ